MPLLSRRPTALALLGALIVARPGRAQSLLPTVSWSVGSVVSGWVLPQPFVQSSGRVAVTAQGVVPLSVQVRVRGWRVDATGAYAHGAVLSLPPEDSDDKGRVLQLSGPTDVRVRATRPLFSDRWRLSLGVNVPTGKTALNSDETQALQSLAAPAFGLPVTAWTTGGGATVGLLRAFGGRNWAAALGASMEKRSEYSPVALAVVGGTLTNTVTPGSAAHFTVGADRLVGAGRVAAVLVADVYTKDLITQTGAGLAPASLAYTLGPQLSANVSLDLSNAGWRERTITVSARRRSAFSDSTGTTVTGSAGQYLDGTLALVRGGVLGSGFLMAVDGHWQSGLPFTAALVGAAASTAGLTLGIDHAGVGVQTRTYLKAQIGSFDTGKTKSTGYGVTLGFSIGSRGTRP
jgi:hypothetical protein